jgi:hypothetical protein
MMTPRFGYGLLLVAALCIGIGAAHAQSTTQTTPQNPAAPCSVIPQAEPCGSKPADKKSTTDKFPFPGEARPTPQSGGQSGSSAPALSGVPQAPNAPEGPLNPGIPADKKFPFPGEGGAPARPNAGSGATSSSSSNSSSSSADGEPNPADGASAPDAGRGPELKDQGSEGQQTQAGRHILHRVNPPGTKLQTADQREAEDLDVARSYMDQENFTGAYMRGLDAVKIAPDDPVAHFIVAEAAMKLDKRQEAIQHYQECLKLDPIDKQAKAARKALDKLQAQR